MKNKILITYLSRICICAILYVVISCNVPDSNISTKKSKIDSLGYDYEKDIYINKILDQKPIFVKTEYETTVIRFDELQIEVKHNKQIPYVQKETWDFYCTKKNGDIIFLESYLGVAEHNVSKITLNRIKSIYNSHN